MLTLLGVIFFNDSILSCCICITLCELRSKFKTKGEAFMQITLWRAAKNEPRGSFYRSDRTEIDRLLNIYAGK